MRVIVLVALFGGAALTSSADAAPDYASMYSRAIALCIEYKLPNAMARPEGFDLDKRLSEVEAERNKLATQFAHPGAISFLRSRIAHGSGDEVEMLCAKELLSAARSARR